MRFGKSEKGQRPKHTFESYESEEQLRLVLFSQSVHIFVLIWETVATPNQRALELGWQTGGNLSGKATGLDAGLGTGAVLFLVDLVLYVCVLGTGLRLGLLGSDAIDMKASTEALGVVCLSGIEVTRGHGSCVGCVGHWNGGVNEDSWDCVQARGEMDLNTSCG